MSHLKPKGLKRVIYIVMISYKGKLITFNVICTCTVKTYLLQHIGLLNKSKLLYIIFL